MIRKTTTAGDTRSKPWQRRAALFAAAWFATCFPGASRGARQGQPPPPAPPETAASVVLVAVDGVRWQEIFRGADARLAEQARLGGGHFVTAAELTPNLHRLAATRGAALGGDGAEMHASGPNYVSLPGYTEMLTGRASRCHDNDCPPIAERTLLDELEGGGSGGPVAVISSWERIERVAAKDSARVVVSAGRTHGATRDALRYDAESARLLDAAAGASSWPGEDDFRRDASTGALAVRYLREKRPRFLFVGLGEPDEFAHAGDYAGYLDAVRSADRVVGDLVRTLDEMGTAGARTTLFVTADHGRAASFRDHGGGWPESSRVWLFGIGAGISGRGILASARAHRLADIGPTIRTLLALAPDASPSAGLSIDELVGAR